MNKISVFAAHLYEAAEQSGKTFAELLPLVKAWGISGVDCELTYLTPDFIRGVKNAGLEISSVYASFGFQDGYDRKAAEAFIDAAAFAGAKTVLCVAGFTEDREKYPVIADGLQKLCAYAKPKGITVTVEDFDDKASPFSTCAGIEYFLEQAPELRVTFDTGNFLYSEESELDAFSRLKDKIVHVHCKDRCLSAKPGESPKITVSRRALYSSPVGKGCIKLREIVSALTESGYSGWFAIEHFGSQNQLDDVAASARWLKTRLGAEKEEK